MTQRLYQKNKALIRRYYEELWNPWNLEAANDLISPEMEFRGSLGIAERGISGFQGYMSTVRSAFPDFHNQVEDLVAEGEKVVARLTYSGTHQGEMFGLPPTGRAISYPGIAIFRISEDKVAEGWVMGDRWGLLQQLSEPVSTSPSS